MPRAPSPGCPASATTTSFSMSSGPSKTPPLPHPSPPQPLLPTSSQHLHRTLGQPVAVCQFNSPPAGFERIVLYCLFPKPGRGAEGWQLLCLGSLPVRGPGLEAGQLARCPLCPPITPSFSAPSPPQGTIWVSGVLGHPWRSHTLPPSPTPGRPLTKQLPPRARPRTLSDRRQPLRERAPRSIKKLHSLYPVLFVLVSPVLWRGPAPPLPWAWCGP